MAVSIALWSCLFTTKLSYTQLFKWGHSTSTTGKGSFLYCWQPLHGLLIHSEQRGFSGTRYCFGPLILGKTMTMTIDHMTLLKNTTWQLSTYSGRQSFMHVIISMHTMQCTLYRSIIWHLSFYTVHSGIHSMYVTKYEFKCFDAIVSKFSEWLEFLHNT